MHKLLIQEQLAWPGVLNKVIFSLKEREKEPLFDDVEIIEI
jgi:hypothetical protein